LEGELTASPFFIAFCLFTLGCASGVVLAKNPVYSAFSLILSFFGLAGLYLMWGTPFIAMIQILIYTGAIVVLFVFVVMMINNSKRTQHSHSWPMVGISAVGAWLFSLLLLKTLTQGSFAGNHPPKEASLHVLARLLFNQYLWPFEVLSLFLLVMIVGIFVLTRAQKGDYQ
jgi:NADH-quinone oxidoreductase subunit J